MSISHKKINSMILSVIDSESFSDYDVDAFRDLCQKIYLIESSVDERSGRKNLSDIRDEVIRRAPEIIGRSS